MSTPKLQLETLFVLDSAGRIVSTREPQATARPVFALVRSTTSCAWAVRSDVSEAVAIELNRLAQEEPPVSALPNPPLHADQYRSLIGDHAQSGPAFTFPQAIIQPLGVMLIEDEQFLERHFRGWVVGEIAAGRAPVMAIMEHRSPVSVCFSARWSDVAAEAGVETARGFRGQGFAPRVTTAWALAVRAAGRTPLYSTDWSNAASLGVARKMGLEVYARIGVFGIEFSGASATLTAPLLRLDRSGWMPSRWAIHHTRTQVYGDLWPHLSPLMDLSILARQSRPLLNQRWRSYARRVAAFRPGRGSTTRFTPHCCAVCSFLGVANLPSPVSRLDG